MIDTYSALFFRSLPLFMKGLQMTLAVMLFASCISLSLGSIFGMITAQRIKIPILSFCVDTITFVCRAIPFYVQLLIFYYVLPDLFGWNLEPFSAAVGALGICSSGYVAQIVRSGINSIPVVQSILVCP